MWWEPPLYTVHKSGESGVQVISTESARNTPSRSTVVKLANAVLISIVQNVKLASSCSLRCGGIARQDLQNGPDEAFFTVSLRKGRLAGLRRWVPQYLTRCARADGENKVE
jgi:hypothetical protein